MASEVYKNGPQLDSGHFLWSHLHHLAHPSHEPSRHTCIKHSETNKWSTRLEPITWWKNGLERCQGERPKPDKKIKTIEEKGNSHNLRKRSKPWGSSSNWQALKKKKKRRKNSLCQSMQPAHLRKKQESVWGQLKSILGEARSGTLTSLKKEVELFVQETFNDPLKERGPSRSPWVQEHWPLIDHILLKVPAVYHTK